MKRTYLIAITSMGQGAFAHDNYLVTITVPDSIAASAFTGTNVFYVSGNYDYDKDGDTIPDRLRTILVTANEAALSYDWDGDFRFLYLTCHVVYDGNGATEGSVPIDATEYHSGDLVTVLGNTGLLKKTGKSFDGWNGKANGNGTDYSVGGTFNIDKSITLYTKWKDRAEAGRTQIGIEASYGKPAQPLSSNLDHNLITVYPIYHVTYDNGEEEDITDTTAPIPETDWTVDHETLTVDGVNNFIVTQTSTGFTDDFDVNAAAEVSRVLDHITATYLFNRVGTGTIVYVH